MKFNTDFHMHSNYSDGTYSPRKLVQKCKNEGLSEIALTDHDGIGGIREAIDAGKEFGIKVIPGIEFSTNFNGHECHLLGYDFDIEDEKLNNRIEDIRRYRKERNTKLLNELKSIGIDIDISELLCMSKGEYVGKPNIARLMVDKGYISNPKEAFEPGKYLEDSRIKAIKRERITIEEAIPLINNAKGYAVLAHPIKLKWFGQTTEEKYWEELENALEYLIPLGLKGMECYYQENKDFETERFVKLCDKYGLIKTRGTDFHGGDLK